ncbi:MAG TPA: histidine phosphatase family protein [Pseudonocardiaceae bacterium]|nr:histidine phosphatase family protein [Pseudonocardiaceae bacterium]
MTLRRLVLLRHGETDYNASGRMQGHFDSELTRTGWNQARFAVPALARFDPELVVASDLRRAMDTATVFTEASGVPLRIDKRLRETNLGQWQGLTAAQADAKWPGCITTWRQDANWAPPEGETRLEVANRAAELVAEVDEQSNETVMLCTHGGLIIGLTAHLIGLPVDVWSQLAGMGNCHWTVLTRRPDEGPRWRLATYNAGITG